MYKNIRLASLVLVQQLLTLVCAAQADTTVTKAPSKYPLNMREKSYRLLVGYHLQQAYNVNGDEDNRKYIEIGVHKSDVLWAYHGPVMLTHGPSVELAPESTPVWGLKYGVAFSGTLVAIGLNAIYYTDFSYGNFKIRPEAGIGLGFVKATFGYNIPTIWNKDFERLRRSGGQLSISILPFKIKTIKETRPSLFQ